VHRRDLPWRRTRDPYRILVSEIMLQQTQVRTVLPYYGRFLRAFPSFRALARTPLNRVLKLWEGLGYYSRARNLHALAQEVVRRHGGRLPAEEHALRSLPGIGPYTAGALLSIAFNQDYPLVDGNVQRVLARCAAIRSDLRRSGTQKRLWKLAAALLPEGRAGDFNQALMELGALVCLPHRPLCGECPVRRNCAAFATNAQACIPFKSPSKPRPHYDIGAAVIRHQRKILITQRPLKGLLGGLWEFPGGKLEKGETLEECVAREIHEELGIQIVVGPKITAVRHAYSHFHITLHAFDCRFRSGRIHARGVADWRWVRPQDLKRFAFPAADQPMIRLLTAATRCR